MAEAIMEAIMEVIMATMDVFHHLQGTKNFEGRA